MQVLRNGDAGSPAARYDDLVVTETADEVLLYDTKKHHIHHLNATTAAVWRHADGTCSLADLARLARQGLNAPVDEATVRLALTKLDDAGLLQQPLADELRMSRMSRRTFIQRAGVTGAIAVPAIVSTTAVVSAQSPGDGCGVGCTPLRAECFLSGYNCVVCFPTSGSTGVCIVDVGFSGADAQTLPAAALTYEQVIAREQELLEEQGYTAVDAGGGGDEDTEGAGEGSDVPPSKEIDPVLIDEGTEESDDGPESPPPGTKVVSSGGEGSAEPTQDDPNQQDQDEPNQQNVEESADQP